MNQKCTEDIIQLKADLDLIAKGKKNRRYLFHNVQPIRAQYVPSMTILALV
jgi:hypothetical protein